MGRISRKGLVSMDESDSTGSIRIISKLFRSKHFVILKYANDGMKVKDTFNRLNYKHKLGETWFVTIPDGSVMSVSLKICRWIRYRSMLFDKGICREFRSECLKNRYAYLKINPSAKRDYPVGSFMFVINYGKKFEMDSLRQHLCRLLFNKSNIDDVY